MLFSKLNKSEPYCRIKSIWYAFVLFIATLYFANENFYLILPICVFLFEFESILTFFCSIKKSKKLQIALLLISVFLATAYLNKIFNGNPIESFNNYYGAFLLFPFLLLCAKFISTPKTLKVLLYLILFECIVAMIEYSMNIRTFFPIDTPPINFTSNFLYDHRVFGLSLNSSVLSFKLLVALLIIETISVKKNVYYVFQIIISIGILITFNRALILTALLFWTFLFVSKFIKSQKLSLKTVHYLSPILIFIVLFLAISKHSFWVELNKKNQEKNPLEIALKEKKYSFSDIEETLLTIHHPRMLEGNELDTTAYLTKKLIGSTKGINTSGRTLIWANFIQFIEQNLWFGNGSDKLFFKEIDHENKRLKLIHAHNSFLEFIATHGILLSIYFGFLLLYLWQKKNSIFLVSILFFSVFQYGIFWGFSLLDFVFISFLISPINLLSNENQ